MSGERTDNEALLDYSDLFGPGRRERPVRIPIKNFKLQARRRVPRARPDAGVHAVDAARRDAESRRVGKIAAGTGGYRGLRCAI
jgi:hypothetical protein